MVVSYSSPDDFNGWLALAKEVEPLFGPMVDEAGFHEALQQAISSKTAFCIRAEPGTRDRSLKGGIVISKEQNEIAWLAVSSKHRQRGYGRRLLEFALGELDPCKRIWVQTFSESVPEGKAARGLYLDFGFIDFKPGGLNPAGVPTVIMRLTGAPSRNR